MLTHLRENRGRDRRSGECRFRGRYADAPDAVAANVTLCAATGVAGLSIEDSTGDKGPAAL